MDKARNHVLFGLERHTPYIRKNDVGYPARGIRTDRHLYIRNFKPDRWPVGDTFYDGMGGSPIRRVLMANSNDPAMQPYIRLSFAKRPPEELYDIKADPDCVYNLIHEPNYARTAENLQAQLAAILKEQKDPRILGDDHYDDIEYFWAGYWRKRRPADLKATKAVHENMEAAGWHHGRIVPLTTSEANKELNRTP